MPEMRADEFSKMRSLEVTNWWFRGRRYLLRGLIRKLGIGDGVILDAGCGTGFAGTELCKAGTVIGLDASEAALAGSGAELARCCVATIQHTPFAAEAFDLIVAMDLLEHLEDESPALKEIRRICKPGGSLFVTVPAYRSLWSKHDEALGHHRRYSAAEIAERIRAAGFEVRKSSYLVTSVFPIAALYRALRRRFGRESGGKTDLFPVPEPFNALLSLLMRVESWLAWHASLPFGLTAVVLARKPESADSTSPEESRG
jgi:SAM-dependent methyltransferase